MSLFISLNHLCNSISSNLCLIMLIIPEEENEVNILSNLVNTCSAQVQGAGEERLHIHTLLRLTLTFLKAFSFAARRNNVHFLPNVIIVTAFLFRRPFK